MKKYFQAPWVLKDLIVVGLISVLLLTLYGLGLYVLNLEEIVRVSEYKSLYIVGFFLFQWILVFVPLLIVTAKKYKLRWSHFGFQKIGVLRMVGMVLGAYFLYLGITFLISLLILYSGIKIPGYQVQESILPLFGSGTFSLVVAGLTVVLVAPLIEEIIFRGFLLRSLTNRMGIVWGSLTAALIFSFLHFPWQSIIPIFIIGLIINSLVLRSKSLWPAIVFHILNNGIAFTLEVLISKDIISLV